MKTWIRYIKKQHHPGSVAVVGAPGLRSVGNIAVKHLIKKLNPELFAELYSFHFSVVYSGPSYLGYPGAAGARVAKGVVELPKVEFYYKEPRLLITKGYQASPQGQLEVASKVVDLYEEAGVERIISLGAHIGKGVQYFVTHPVIKREMIMHRIEKSDTDRFIGFSGLVLDIGRKRGMEGFCLLGGTSVSLNPEYPDLYAAKTVLDKLCEILDIKIETSELRKKEVKKAAKEEIDLSYM